MRVSTVAVLAFAAVTLAAPVMAQREAAPYTIVETGESFGRLSDAVQRIGASRGTIEVAPGTWRDCAVQTEGYVVFRARVPGQSIFDGGVCEGKATLVLRGAGAEVHGLVFTNIGVSDGNGAGIRLEKSDLVVTQSWFRDSEQGILTGDDEASNVRIDKSTFTRLGRCDRGLSCAHSIYIGRYGALSVTRSRFEAGNGGHYVKSRARRIDVADSSFDDTRGRTTNYMIDIPNGATGSITGNIMVQGADKENYSAFITVSPEGRETSSAGLRVENNDASFAPGIQRESVFLANWTVDAVELGANRLGRGLKPFERR